MFTGYREQLEFLSILDRFVTAIEKLTEPSPTLPSGQQPCPAPSLQGASEGQMTQEQFAKKHGDY